MLCGREIERQLLRAPACALVTGSSRCARAGSAERREDCGLRPSRGTSVTKRVGDHRERTDAVLVAYRLFKRPYLCLLNQANVLHRHFRRVVGRHHENAEGKSEDHKAAAQRVRAQAVI
eukprot:108732-Prymnesium_polylepis.2